MTHDQCNTEVDPILGFTTAPEGEIDGRNFFTDDRQVWFAAVPYDPDAHPERCEATAPEAFFICALPKGHDSPHLAQTKESEFYCGKWFVAGLAAGRAPAQVLA